MNSNVQISDGLRIDDAFAGRLVTKMLHALNERAGNFTGALHRTDTRSSLGNPKGQKRIFDRICIRNRFGILAAGLQTGTRCRFKATFDLWDATSADDWDQTKGPLSWLLGSRVEITGKGPGVLEDDTTELVAVSRHALERLVQRGHAQTPEAFIEILKRAWVPLSLALNVAAELPRDGHTSWTLPIDLPNGKTAYLLLMRNVKKSGPILIATTAFTQDMIVNPQALAPLKDLLKSWEGRNDLAELVRDPRLGPAFRETVRAVRRGRT